jgi:lipid II:glycine glycyltransferase (peptidoglycan interpeptide bridge formation enzyme)
MKARQRNLARNFDRHGVVVTSGGESAIPAFYELLSATARRRGFGIFPLRYYETMFRVFSRQQRAELFMASIDGEPVATNFVLGYGDSARYLIGASSASTNARPMVALQWAAIRWAKAQGYDWYDFEGIRRNLAEAHRQNGSLPDEAMDGPTRFKLSFGGRVEIFAEALDRAPDPLLRPVVKLLAPRIDQSTVRSTKQRLLGLQRGAGLP